MFKFHLFQGHELLKTIDNARKGLGKFDVRMIEGINLAQALDEFEVLVNRDKKNEFIKRLFSKKSTLLKGLLDQDWNAGLVPAIHEPNIVYKEITPVKSKTLYECEDCPATVKPFKNANAFKRHVKEVHQKEVKPTPARVTCMLPDVNSNDPYSKCKATQPLSQMYRHFEEVGFLHKYICFICHYYVY